MPRPRSHEESVASECAAAFARGEVESALLFANDEWEKTGAGEVGHAVEVIAAKLTQPPTRAGRGSEAFHDFWLRQSDVSGPATTAWLCGHLLSRLPVVTSHADNWKLSYLRKKYGALLKRIARLERRTPRPLVARAMLKLIIEAPMSALRPAFAREIYRPALTLLSKTGDARHADDLARLLEEPRAGQQSVREMFSEELPRVISTLRRRGSMSKRLRDSWKAAFPASSGGTDARVELLDTVVSQPDDDGPRAVLADFLSERGDPRGEFISLQLRHASGTLDATGRSRMNALLKANRRTWLGALDRVCASAEWERGFLTQLTLAQNAASTPDGWEKASQSDVLLTVEHLYKGRSNGRHLECFVLSPQAVNLRSTDLLDSSVLEALTTGPERRIETVRLHRVPNPSLFGRLVTTASLPRLKRVVFWNTDQQEKIERALLESSCFESSRPMTFVFAPERIAFDRAGRSTGQAILRGPDLGWLETLLKKVTSKRIALAVRASTDGDF